MQICPWLSAVFIQEAFVLFQLAVVLFQLYSFSCGLLLSGVSFQLACCAARNWLACSIVHAALSMPWPHAPAQSCVIHAQVAQADLQKIADSVNEAQAVYQQLKARREGLGRAVEALKLMHEWQARRLIPLLLI